MKYILFTLLVQIGLCSLAQTKPHQSPDSVRLVTADLENYLRAYDLAQADTANRQAIFKQEYIDKASIGLQDYYKLRIKSVKSFVASQDQKPAFYAAIRPNLLTITSKESQIRAALRRMKAIYPAATFVDVYFVVGRWNSAGTVSANGLLIGTDMVTQTDNIPVHELNTWERTNFKSIENVPYLVIHELVHTMQRTNRNQSTVLVYSINEGMCDFIGELAAGHHPNDDLHEWASPREAQLWQEFQTEMDQPSTSRWLYGNPTESDRLPDVGYYVGYQIVKAFYEQATNKEQAIYDILHIRDYKTFLTTSRYAQKMAARQSQASK